MDQCFVPAMQLDHLFICVSSGAPEADRLTAFGLSEGAPNTHPGQGTACRRFFFRNAYLELLWVSDSTEARSETTRPTRLWERWLGRNRGACPFGLGFRPRMDRSSELPFATWEYRPSYLPPPLSIQVAKNVDVLAEPMLFLLAFAQPPDSYPATKRQLLDHRCGLRELTRVEVVRPDAGKLSPEFQAVINANLVRLRAGTKDLLELGFDGESRGKSVDFRPELPLRFRW
jgi:hypothetical protein